MQLKWIRWPVTFAWFLDKEFHHILALYFYVCMVYTGESTLHPVNTTNVSHETLVAITGWPD